MYKFAILLISCLIATKSTADILTKDAGSNLEEHDYPTENKDSFVAVDVCPTESEPTTDKELESIFTNFTHYLKRKTITPLLFFFFLGKDVIGNNVLRKYYRTNNIDGYRLKRDLDIDKDGFKTVLIEVAKKKDKDVVIFAKECFDRATTLQTKIDVTTE